jgi:hypothetical protein
MPPFAPMTNVSCCRRAVQVLDVAEGERARRAGVRGADGPGRVGDRPPERVLTRAAVEQDVDLMGRAGEVEIDDEPVGQIAAGHRDLQVRVEGRRAEHGPGPVVDELDHLRAPDVGA